MRLSFPGRFRTSKRTPGSTEGVISISARISAKFILLLLTLSIAFLALNADPIPVRRSQGTFRGFLALKTLEGTPLAVGDLIQVAHGNHVVTRLTFRFRDGSLDDETTVFTQHGVFRLISDHHVQHGPSFPHPLDMTIDVASGQVVSRDKDGKPSQHHFNLTPDTVNGLPLVVLLNLDSSGPPTRLPMIAPAEKPRLVHVVISSDGEDFFSIGGIRHKVDKFSAKIDLGGVAGIVAPLVGKQPSDIHLWVLEGDAPAFIKMEGQFYEDGPVWRVELISPVAPGPGK